MKINRGNATFIVIIIALLVLGLVAVFAVTQFGIGQSLFTNKDTNQSVGPVASSDKQLDTLNSLSTSDEVGDIEKDLNATDLENVDSDLNNANADLNSL